MDLNITLDHGFGTVNARFGVGASASVSKQFYRAMTLCGHVLAEEVKRGWSGEGRPGWAPLHPFTVQEKGHDEKLYHSGALADAVVVVQDASSVAVGVNDPELAGRALIQEKGVTILITPKMRAFLASRGFGPKGPIVLNESTIALVIPARPNFSRALGEKLPELAEIITLAIEDFYKGAA